MRVSITVGSTTQETTLEELMDYNPRTDVPAGTKETIIAGLRDLFREAVEEEWARVSDSIGQAAKVMGWDLS